LLPDEVAGTVTTHRAPTTVTGATTARVAALPKPKRNWPEAVCPKLSTIERTGEVQDVMGGTRDVRFPPPAIDT
jgi:hypothetical protein